MKYFNELGSLALAIASILSTPVAHAVWYGEYVKQEDAEDFRVFVDGSAGNCAGQLIAGQYVITAMHCVDKSSRRLRQIILDRNGISTTPDRIDDINLLEASLTPAEYSSTIYVGSNQRYGGDAISVSESIINPKYVWGYRYGSYTDKKNDVRDNLGLAYDFDLAGDLVILKLSKMVEQETASILDVGDIVSPLGKVATLMGWGKDESGTLSQNLQAGSLSLQALPYNLGDPKGLKNVYSPTDPLADSFFDYPKLNRTDNGNGFLQQSDQGDSGSPVILDDFTLGFVSGKTVTTADNKATGITGPAYWIKTDPWLVRNIDAVNTVSKVSKVIDASFTAHEWKIPVQSLKAVTVNINSTVDLLNNSSNGFTVNSDCNPTLNTGEYW